MTQLMNDFEVINLEYIPQTGNIRADLLSKLVNDKEKRQLYMVT